FISQYIALDTPPYEPASQPRGDLSRLHVARRGISGSSPPNVPARCTVLSGLFVRPCGHPHFTQGEIMKRATVLRSALLVLGTIIAAAPAGAQVTVGADLGL